MYNIVIIV